MKKLRKRQIDIVKAQYVKNKRAKFKRACDALKVAAVRLHKEFVKAQQSSSNLGKELKLSYVPPTLVPDESTELEFKVIKNRLNPSQEVFIANGKLR